MFAKLILSCFKGSGTTYYRSCSFQSCSSRAQENSFHKGGVFRAIVASTDVKPGVVSDVIVPTIVISGVDISITFPVELTVSVKVVHMVVVSTELEPGEP